MSDMPDSDRRRLLQALGSSALVAGLAGCSDGDSDGGTTETAAGGTPTSGTETGQDDDTDAETDEGTGGPLSVVTKLASDQGEREEQLGDRVALSADGSTALVGAPQKNESSPEAGVDTGWAYVFTRSDGTWTQATQLAPPDDAGAGSFGQAVALSADGTTALVGDQQSDDPDGYAGTGATYHFERAGGGWSFEGRLMRDAPRYNDNFGKSVALSNGGDVAVVGADGATRENSNQLGAFFVFERSDGGWERTYLDFRSSETDGFGQAVALSGAGDVILVAAPDADEPNGTDSGTVSVYERAEEGWRLATTIVPEDGESGESFGANATGTSMALSDDGTRAIVGVYRDDIGEAIGAGAAYVFAQSTDGWRQQAKLAVDDGDVEDQFGNAVALTDGGDMALVGAHLNDVGDTDALDHGSVYVFEYADESWSQVNRLVASQGNNEGDKFGSDVALGDSGAVALVGAEEDADPNGLVGGSAYVFER